MCECVCVRARPQRHESTTVTSTYVFVHMVWTDFHIAHLRVLCRSGFCVTASNLIGGGSGLKSKLGVPRCSRTGSGASRLQGLELGVDACERILTKSSSTANRTKVRDPEDATLFLQFTSLKYSLERLCTVHL